MTKKQKTDLVGLLRAGVPRILALDQLGLAADDLAKALAADADLAKAVDDAEELARARVRALLYRRAVEGEDATAGRDWLRSDDAERQRIAGQDRPAEAWHSGNGGGAG